jgi:hypothetical protein
VVGVAVVLELAALHPRQQLGADPPALEAERDRDRRSPSADHRVGCDPAIEPGHPCIGCETKSLACHSSSTSPSDVSASSRSATSRAISTATIAGASPGAGGRKRIRHV